MLPLLLWTFTAQVTNSVTFYPSGSETYYETIIERNMYLNFDLSYSKAVEPINNYLKENDKVFILENKEHENTLRPLSIIQKVIENRLSNISDILKHTLTKMQLFDKGPKVENKCNVTLRIPTISKQKEFEKIMKWSMEANRLVKKQIERHLPNLYPFQKHLSYATAFSGLTNLLDKVDFFLEEIQDFSTYFVNLAMNKRFDESLVSKLINQVCTKEDTAANFFYKFELESCSYYNKNGQNGIQCRIRRTALASPVTYIRYQSMSHYGCGLGISYLSDSKLLGSPASLKFDPKTSPSKQNIFISTFDPQNDCIKALIIEDRDKILQACPRTLVNVEIEITPYGIQFNTISQTDIDIFGKFIGSYTAPLFLKIRGPYTFINRNGQNITKHFKSDKTEVILPRLSFTKSEICENYNNDQDFISRFLLEWDVSLIYSLAGLIFYHIVIKGSPLIWNWIIDYNRRREHDRIRNAPSSPPLRQMDVNRIRRTPRKNPNHR